MSKKQLKQHLDDLATNELVKYTLPKCISVKFACIACDGGEASGEWLEGQQPYVATCTTCGSTYTVTISGDEQ